MPATPSDRRREGGGLEERFQSATPSTRYEYLDVHFLTAGVDVVIEHSLRPPYPNAIGYKVVQASAACSIYHDTSGDRREWTENTVVLRSNRSNVVVRVLLLLASTDDLTDGILDQGPAGVTVFGAVTAGAVSAGAMTLSGLLTTNGQVAFPATHNPSTDPNTLDDYEEGAWTPVLRFGGGSTGLAYTVQLGRYVKIGRVVTVAFRLDLSAKGSSTGAATIAGLPFTAENVAASPLTWAGQAIAGAMAALTSPLTPRVVGNTTIIDLYDWGAAGIVAVDDTNFTDSSVLLVSLTYFAAS